MLINKYTDDYDYLFEKMQKKYGTNPRDEIPLPKVELPEKPIASAKPEKEVGDAVGDDDEYSDYSYSEYEEEEETRGTKQSGAKSPGFMDDVDSMFSNFIKSSKKLLNEFGVSAVSADTKQVTKKPSARVKADIGGSLIDYDSNLQKTVGDKVNKSVVKAMEKVDTVMGELVVVMKEEDELWQQLHDLSSQEYMSMITGYQ